jgi:hypothetical protein
MAAKNASAIGGPAAKVVRRRLNATKWRIFTVGALRIGAGRDT